jgi:hypothetical protein
MSVVVKNPCLAKRARTVKGTMTYAVTRPVPTSESRTVDVNCRNTVVTVRTAAKLVASQLVNLVPVYMCPSSVYGAGAAARIIETVASSGRTTPGPSRTILAIIEHTIPDCTVIAVLNTTAATAIDLVVQPASAMFFHARLLSAANHRKLI